MSRTFGAREPFEDLAIHHLAMDNVNIEERGRYCFSEKGALGGLRIARESKYKGNLEIRSAEDVALLRAAFERGDILLSKEMTVLVIVRNGGPSAQIVPVFTSGTSKLKGYEPKADDQAFMIIKAAEIWRAKYEATRGFLGSVSMDADNTNSKTNKILGIEDDMPRGALRTLVAECPLVDLTSDEHFVVSCTDDQHNAKNHRGKLLSSGGFRIDKVKIDRMMLIGTVHVMTGIPTKVLEGYWPKPKTDDHQNVKSMVMGMQALAQLEGIGLDDAKVVIPDRQKPGVAARLRELQPVALIASCWVFLFMRYDASLSQHVTNLAKMGAAVFVMKRHSSSSLAAQTARSIARAIGSHIKCLARAIIEGYKEFYIFLDATHLLEQLFGIVRTLCGPQRNFDPVQLEDRLSTVVGLHDVYEDHPEWKKTPRRLGGKSLDHYNVKSWTGDVDPQNVTLANSWRLGLDEAIETLAKTGIYTERELDIDAIVKKDPSATLFYWNGRGSASMDVTAADDDHDGSDDDGSDVASDDGSSPSPAASSGEAIEADEEPEPEPESDSERAAALDPAADGFASAADAFEEKLEEEEHAAADVPGQIEFEAEAKLPTKIKDNDGNVVYIARVVKDMFSNAEVVKTTARFGPHGRVAGALKSGRDTSRTIGDAEPQDDMERIFRGDHAGTLVSVNYLPTMVVVEVAGLVGPNGVDASNVGLTAAEFTDSRSNVRVQPLKSSATGTDALLFSGDYSNRDFNATGGALVPLTLGVTTAEGAILLSAEVAVLEAVAKELWARAADEEGVIDRLPKLPTDSAHKNGNGLRLFTTDEGTLVASDAGSRRSCALCQKGLPDAKSALNHSAYHMVHTPTKFPYEEVCPLCCGPAEKCAAFVVSSGGNKPQPRILCSMWAPAGTEANLDAAVKLTAAAIEVSKPTSPSTNHPIVCPTCHPGLAEEKHGGVPAKRKDKVRPAVWSYNMQAHWTRLHSTTIMPAGLATAIKLAPEERGRVSKP